MFVENTIRRLEEARRSPTEHRRFSLSSGILSITARCRLAPRWRLALKTFSKVRRFIARNWKFLVQVGVNILTVMHK